MNKLIAVVFPDEKNAYEAVHALQELHGDGSVTLYGSTVVQRQAHGSLSVEEKTDQGPLSVAVGSVIGALIGLFGGAPGIIAGLGAGGLIGGWGHYLHTDVSDEFLEDIARELRPGDFAVIAEVQEEWTTPVDTRMAQLGGKVVRESRKTFVEDLIEKRIKATKSEVETRKTERQSAKAEKMASELTAQIEDAAEKLARTADKARDRLERAKEEMNAKIQALQEQAANARPEVKTRIEQRIAEVRKDFSEREQKLNRAYALTQEALV